MFSDVTPQNVIVPTPFARYVIVHYHIFKNGGSTIEFILQRMFRERFARLHGRGTEAALDAADLRGFLRKYPEVAAVSSHHLRYPKPALRDSIIFDCCFLRHPLQRIRSIYTYLRKLESTDALCQLARRLTAPAFARHLIDQLPHLISNVQVIQLSRAGRFTRPASQQDLDRATAILQDMAIPGVVEMFDESLVAAEYFLQPAFPAIGCEYIAQNVTREPHVGVADPESELAEYWGAGVQEDLVRLNEFDFELHRRARQEVVRRLGLVPSPVEKLAQFQSRCSRLYTEAAKAS